MRDERGPDGSSTTVSLLSFMRMLEALSTVSNHRRGLKLAGECHQNRGL